jgi:hypothetical protein
MNRSNLTEVSQIDNHSSKTQSELDRLPTVIRMKDNFELNNLRPRM